MKKYVIKTMYNFDPSKGKEKGGGISLTVPDQTLSLQTLLERFTRGQSVATLTPVFHGDQEFPDFDRMDAVDLEIYKKNLTNSLMKASAKASQAEAKAPVAPPPNPPVEDIEGV